MSVGPGQPGRYKEGSLGPAGAAVWGFAHSARIREADAAGEQLGPVWAALSAGGFLLLLTLVVAVEGRVPSVW